MKLKMKCHATLLAACLVVCLASGTVAAAEVAGIRIDDTTRVGGSDLVLNGAGVRSRFFIKVYVGALYVGQKAATPAAVYDSPAPSRMLLHLLRGMEAKTLHEALDEGLRNNLTADELAAVQEPAGQLGKLLLGIGAVREGDVVTLDFSSAGVAVGFNGEARGTVAGAVFAKALLRVWLGDKPADAGLKKSLLGG
jgi:long-chain acyl-CoA synthetase